MTKKSNFTEGRIAAPLIRFALPVLLAMCLQSLYGAVDMMFLVAVPFASIMNTLQEAVSGTLSYFRICSGGSIFITISWFAKRDSVCC